MMNPVMRWSPAAAIAIVLVCGACAPASPISPVSPVAPPSAQPVCVSTLAIERTTFSADGAIVTGQVTSSAPTCGWSITAPEWIRVVPDSGTGSAAVSVAVLASTDQARTGTVAIGSETILVAQDAPASMFVNARCHHPAVIGSNPGICTVFVRESGTRVTVDLRAFGRSETYGLVYVPASSGLWDLDLRVPSDFPTGVVALTFTGVDARGRTERITAPLEIR